MASAALDSIFRPKSVAVIGASDKPGSVGGAILSNLRRYGFENPLCAVNSSRGTACGATAFGSLAEVPYVPDLAVICTPAPTVPKLLDECGRRGTGGAIVISAGFRESGPEGRQREEQVKEICRSYPQLRVIGPNCLGVLRTSNRFNASFAPVMPSRGRLTLLSQSGALCTAILDWSLDQEIGFANVVSVGNMANVGFGDLIDYFADDPETDAILLYIEGINDAMRFLSAARACTRRKPIIAFKSGRFSESAHAAASHTGAIATSDAVYEAVFRRAGIERVHSIEELFDCAELLIRPARPHGSRLAVVTNAGGPGVMASDAWLSVGGSLAQLSAETLQTLDRQLPSCWSHGNPIDVLGDANVERFESAIGAALADPNVDALAVIVTPQTMTDPELIAEAVVAAQSRTDKPIVAAWIGGPSVQAGRIVLKRAGVPTYEFPEAAVQALKHLTSPVRPRAADCPEPSDRPTALLPPEQLARWKTRLDSSHGLLDEGLAKDLLTECGIRTARAQVATSPEMAVTLADQMGYPVVLKVVSPDVSHKTDVGGVVLNLANSHAVREQYLSIVQSVLRHRPSARIEGISVQPMIAAARGVELLLGMTRDPQFGPVILIGAGGITAELQKDTALEVSPISESTIQEMLRRLRLYPLLEGYRGRPGVNLSKLTDAVSKFVQMTEILPQLTAAEINPLLATADEVIALDARFIVSDAEMTARDPIRLERK